MATAAILRVQPRGRGYVVTSQNVVCWPHGWCLMPPLLEVPDTAWCCSECEQELAGPRIPLGGRGWGLNPRCCWGGGV